MQRIPAVDPATADEKVKPLLDGVQRKLGVTPNMMRTMAQSSAMLEGYLNLSGALAKGSISGPVAELIALDVAEANSCSYCLSAHAYLAENVAKLDDGEIASARHADSTDPKVAAALVFARQVNEERGQVTDEQLEAVRAAGYDSEAITEIIGHVALNVLTNYFNKAAGVEVDFPVILPADEEVAAA